MFLVCLAFPNLNAVQMEIYPRIVINNYADREYWESRLTNLEGNQVKESLYISIMCDVSQL